MSRCTSTATRLLIVPGLHDSGPAHWQSWLERQHRDAVRVNQHDWASTDLERWAARIGNRLAREAQGRWIAVAHSFGALALVRHLLLQHSASPVAAALLVAPADPDRFGHGEWLSHGTLSVPTTLILSDTDPCIAPASARRWAHRWGCPVVSLGDAGHINSEAGFGPLPIAARWVSTMMQRLERQAPPASCAEAPQAAVETAPLWR